MFNNRAGSFLSMQKNGEVVHVGGERRARVKGGEVVFFFFFSTTFSNTGMEEGQKLWGNWWRDVPRRWEGADLSPEIRKKSRKEGRPTKVRVRWFHSLALLELEKVFTDDYSNENGGTRTSISSERFFFLNNHDDDDDDGSYKYGGKKISYRSSFVCNSFRSIVFNG